MSTTEMRRLKKQADLMSNISFVATTDNQAILKVGVDRAAKAIAPGSSGSGAVAPVAAPQPTMSPEMARAMVWVLVEVGRSQPVAAPPPVQAAKPNRNALTQPVFSAQGVGNKKVTSIRSRCRTKGKQQAGEAVADEEKLVLNLPVMTLVLAKAD
jgi:hypothetical protein